MLHQLIQACLITSVYMDELGGSSLDAMNSEYSVDRERRDMDDQCPESERFNECATQCPKYCGAPRWARGCTLPCVPGCECRWPYIRSNEDTNSACMSPRECISTGPCGENQLFSDCAPNCQPTCDQPNMDTCNANTPIGCAIPPNSPCYCVSGYLKSGDTCVRPEDCPSITPTCADNEVFDPCGGCETRCVNGQVTTIERCDHDVCMLPGRCRCRTHFTRDTSGVCVARCAQ